MQRRKKGNAQVDDQLWKDEFALAEEMAFRKALSAPPEKTKKKSKKREKTRKKSKLGVGGEKEEKNVSKDNDGDGKESMKEIVLSHGLFGSDQTSKKSKGHSG